MRKKVLGIILTTIMMFGTGQSAYATGKYYCQNRTYAQLPSVHTDSAHWRYRNGLWMCADNDYQQALYERWIETDGKWYFVGISGHMLKDTYIIDLFNNEKYYVDDNGVCVTGNLFEQQ